MKNFRKPLIWTIYKFKLMINKVKIRFKNSKLIIKIKNKELMKKKELKIIKELIV